MSMEAEERARDINCPLRQAGPHQQHDGKPCRWCQGAKWGQSNPKATAVARVLWEAPARMVLERAAEILHDSEDESGSGAESAAREIDWIVRRLPQIEAMIPEPEPKEAGDACEHKTMTTLPTCVECGISVNPDNYTDSA